MYEESNLLELKREVTDDLKKEVVAFANTDGGTILIGIDDDGSAVGIEAVDKEVNKVSSILRDGIKPYYIASKGMKPTGVYKPARTFGSTGIRRANSDDD